MSTPDSTSSVLGKHRSDRVLGVLLGVVLAVIAVGVAVFARADNRDRTVAVPGGPTRTVAIQLGDMHIIPANITVPAGTRLILQVTNTDDIRHDLYIDAGPQTPLLTPEQTARLDLGTLNHTHTLHGWCTVPGHKAAGMTMTITVTTATANASPTQQSPTHH